MARQHNLSDLMQHRVREVLLVSSLYDSYILQEDGHLTEKVYTEYETLNLSSAPRFTHVSTGAAALELVNLRRFDLVLLVTRLLDMDILRFARRIKDRPHPLPVVLLAFNSRDLGRLEQIVDDAAIDGVFTWNGDAKILLTISKYVEDRANVDEDIAAADVRVILVVEDSIRYYSSFLSVLYPELMMQSQSLVSEGMNRLQRLMRMRTRPKVLLARSFEQATELYARYAENLIAIISDAGFPREGRHDPDAGVALLSRIREDAPDLPILLQSSEQKYEAMEAKLRLLFVNKHSQRLLQRIRLFLRDYLGFGPFVFRMPDRSEICRAKDVMELEQCIRQVPAASLEYHASRQHFSNWLTARSEFAMAEVMRPQQVSDFDTAEVMRAQTLQELRALRRNFRAGVISDLSRAVFETDGLFTRLSTGSLGGKARGIAFMNQLLAESGESVSLGGMRVTIPQCFVLATDAFDEFLEKNSLERHVYGNDDDDDEIARAFLAATLPDQVARDLEMVLSNVHYPLAIRSSSLLEDNMLHPFAGIYGTVVLSNSAPSLELRLYELKQAVKYVYATTFFQGARAYLRSANRRTEEEKMAVIIQQLVGRRHSSLYYPHCSGVAHSCDLFASSGEEQRALVQLALGFGRIIVEGGAFVRFDPRSVEAPSMWARGGRPSGGDQQQFYALDPASPLQVEGAHLRSPLRLFDLDVARRDGTLALAASHLAPHTGELSHSPDAPGAPVVTFRSLLRSKDIPLAPTLARLLEMLSEGMGSAVELEFACDLGDEASGKGSADNEHIGSGEPSDGSPAALEGQPTLFALQVRPVVTRDIIDDHTAEIFDPKAVICRTSLAVGWGIRALVHDIVYVIPDAYDPAHTTEIALQLSRLNHTLDEAGRSYVLLGPGRWGSADHWLGIPVRWQDISRSVVVVEASSPEVALEPSQSTHFFNNILSVGAGYFVVPPRQPGQRPQGFVDWDWLASRRAAWESRFVRHLRLEEPVIAAVDGRRGVGTIARSPVPGRTHT